MRHYKQGAFAQRDMRAALLEKRRTPSDVTRKAVKKKKKKSEADPDEPTFSLKKNSVEPKKSIRCSPEKELLC